MYTHIEILLCFPYTQTLFLVTVSSRGKGETIVSLPYPIIRNKSLFISPPPPTPHPHPMLEYTTLQLWEELEERIFSLSTSFIYPPLSNTNHIKATQFSP